MATYTFEDGSLSNMTFFSPGTGTKGQIDSGQGANSTSKCLKIGCDDGTKGRFDDQSSFNNGTIEGYVKPSTSAGGAYDCGWLARTTNWSTTTPYGGGYYACLFGNGLLRLYFHYNTNDGYSTIVASTEVTYSSGTWAKLKYTFNGTSHKVWYNDTLVIDVTDSNYTGTGQCGVCEGGSSLTARVDEITVTVDTGLTAVNKDYSTQYTVWKAVNKDLSPAYAVVAGVWSALSPQYQVIGAVSSSFSTQYVVRTAVSSDLSPTYSLWEFSAYSDFVATYSIPWYALGVGTAAGTSTAVAVGRVFLTGEPMNAGYIEFHLSGYAYNSLASASLGGGISDTVIAGQRVTLSTAVGGISVTFSGGFTPGGGHSLKFVASTSTISVKDSTDTNYGAEVDISTGTKFAVEGETKGSMVVTVNQGNFPAQDTTVSFISTNRKNTLWDDVTRAQAAGSAAEEYRCFFIKNTHPLESFTSIKIFAPPPDKSGSFFGQNTLRLAFDPVGVGNGVTTGVAEEITDETTVPSTPTFVIASDFDNAITLGSTLAAGECVAVWMERSYPTPGGGAPSFIDDFSNFTLVVTYDQPA